MELNEELGEVICDECDGKGEVQYQIDECQSTEVRCPKCFGDGKLDWVENAMGKKKESEPIFFASVAGTWSNYAISSPTPPGNLVISDGDDISITIGTDGVDFGDVPVMMRPNTGDLRHNSETGYIDGYIDGEWRPVMRPPERIEKDGLSNAPEWLDVKGKGLQYLRKVKSGLRAGSDYWRNIMSRMSWVGMDKSEKTEQ